MRQTPLGLILAAVLAAPALAANFPALVRLDGELAKAQDARERGVLSPKDYKELASRFRAELAAAEAAAPPSPENASLEARILSRLGASGEAAADLERALKTRPDAPALHAALSQVRYDERNYPAALAEADAALTLDPSNREALTLKHFSEGRADMGGAGAEPATARRAGSRKIRVARLDPAKMPYRLPIKVSRAEPPPELIAAGRAAAPQGPGPLPLLSLAGAATLGFAAFGVARSRGTYESADGLDEAHPAPSGPGQRFVAGALLTAMAAASIYTLGSMAASAAPAALSLAANFGGQAVRLAGSEAGAINPGEARAANEIPRMLARVIPLNDGVRVSGMVGPFGQSSTFVTAAEDIAGTPAAQLSERLGIESAPRYAIIRFPVSSLNVASRITYGDSALFIGRGLTSGGAREYQIPNIAIPEGATIEIVKAGK